jgi:hypothetical protein
MTGMPDDCNQRRAEPAGPDSLVLSQLWVCLFHLAILVSLVSHRLCQFALHQRPWSMILRRSQRPADQRHKDLAKKQSFCVSRGDFPLYPMGTGAE